MDYSPSDVRRYREERDISRRELEIISKQAGIADLEWQHQRKQLLETIDGKPCNHQTPHSVLNNTNRRCTLILSARDAEHDRLKALDERLANKVNAPDDTPAAPPETSLSSLAEFALHGRPAPAEELSPAEALPDAVPRAALQNERELLPPPRAHARSRTGS